MEFWSRWVCRLGFIASFFFLYDTVFWYLFKTVWNRSIIKVTFYDLFLIMWSTFGNIKHLTIYTTFHIIYVILCVMLDLHVPKIIAYLIDRVVLFLYPSFFPIHAIQKKLIFEGVIMEIFSSWLDKFLVCASYFLLI